MPLGSEKNFTGIIDVIRMKAYCYKAGGDGIGKEGEIPTPYEEAASAAHEALVEMIAEGNDELMEEFFATGTLPCEHIISGLQEADSRASCLSGSLRLVQPKHRRRPSFKLHFGDLSVSARAPRSPPL